MDEQRPGAEHASERCEPAATARRLLSTRTGLAAVVGTGVAMALLTGCGAHDDANAPKKVAGGAAPAAGDPSGSASAKGSTAAPSSQSGKNGGENADDQDAPGPGGHGTGGTSGGKTGSGSSDDGPPAHPCDIQNLALRVTTLSGAASRRIIEARNTGGSACSLSSSPGVDLGDSDSADQSKNIKPILASGTARFSVPAGQSAYTVIDLDPSGATTGTARGINELNVLADQDGTNMPLANTENFPLSRARVLNPKMGLYQSTVADAITSMESAGN